jgi:ArsR family transcriptional regulator, arsenate/arsenite/antimonite-responsive transcriptional repressor
LTNFDLVCYALGMDTTTVPRSLPVHASDPAEPCCGDTAAPPSLDAARTFALADRLKALADPTRLRMLDLLAQQDAPLCVCHITAQFEQHQPTISHHLRILREAGLISGEKRGTWSYYWTTEDGKRSLSLVRTFL